MALFDRLVADNWRTTVIDLGYGLFDQFFAVMAEIGFEQEARRRGIEPIVLFITDSAPTTARSYAELRRAPAADHLRAGAQRSDLVHVHPAGFSADARGMRPDPHSAAVADRARRHRPAGLLVRRLYGQAAGRPDRSP